MKTLASLCILAMSAAGAVAQETRVRAEIACALSAESIEPYR